MFYKRFEEKTRQMGGLDSYFEKCYFISEITFTASCR